MFIKIQDAYGFDNVSWDSATYILPPHILVQIETRFHFYYVLKQPSFSMNSFSSMSFRMVHSIALSKCDYFNQSNYLLASPGQTYIACKLERMKACRKPFQALIKQQKIRFSAFGIRINIKI
jgi:hypothetical protein